MRRLIAAAVALAALAGCAQNPASRGSKGVELRVTAEHTSGGDLRLTVQLVNGGDTPVMFRDQRTPYVVRGSGGAVQISAHRDAPGPGTTIYDPSQAVPMVVVEPGQAGSSELLVGLPLAEHVPVFPATAGWPSPGPGVTFCLGVSAPGPGMPSPAEDGTRRASAIDPDDGVVCTALADGAITPIQPSYEPVS